ncbi:Ig-like domain-containing protein [Flammeovirga sp. SubArs3]|uniref:Ig-like domain-containing protein n=1 Tax=Flammeovirga sp. SubArs3 TaxID=2995316 RepID=UPI00248CED7C|nr:Ig-like domain-containing protein [Flammeovirga sp. SubArs3]
MFWHTTKALLLLLLLSTISYGQNTEICNNGIDDDNDGLIDCYDPDCAFSPDCRGSIVNNFSLGCNFDDYPNTPSIYFSEKLNSHDLGIVIDKASGVLVGDMDNDGVAELVVKSSTDGMIYILNTVDQSVKYSIPIEGSSHSYSQMAIADVDGNGNGDIFINVGKNIHRYEFGSSGVIAKTTVGVGHEYQSPQLADFNEDGIPEVYIGNAIYNAIDLTSIIAFDNDLSSGNSVGQEAFSIAYNIFDVGDRKPTLGTFSSSDHVDGLELVAGNVVYAVDISGQSLTKISEVPNNDGFVSIADFDSDHRPEIVTVTQENNQAEVYLWSPYNQTVLGEYFLTSSTIGGRVAIGDVDGDQVPEIIGTGQYQLYILDYENGNLEEQWIFDQTSNDIGLAGVSLFDLNGDGKSEIFFNDDTKVYAIRNQEGTFNISSYEVSGENRAEYPIVADIDNDGQTEVIVTLGGTDDGGLIAINAYDQFWVTAQSYWNQNGFHITNTNFQLEVAQELQSNSHSYFDGILNTFSSQASYYTPEMEVLNAAPDIVLRRVQSDVALCNNNGILNMIMTVQNVGNQVVPSNMVVSIFDGNPYETSATLIDTFHTSVPIHPLDTLQFTLQNRIPTDGSTVNAFVVLNHNPYNFDNTVKEMPVPADSVYSNIQECNFTNNLIGPFIIEDCLVPVIVDLDNDNSSGRTGLDYESNYFVGTQQSGRISDIDTRVFAFSAGALNRVEISFADGQPLEATDSLMIRGVLPSGIGVNSPSDTQNIVLLGVASTDAYEEALKLIYFTNAALTDRSQRQIEVKAQLVPNEDFGPVATAYVNIKARPTSSDQSLTIDEDELYTFSTTNFPFNSLDGLSFDGIRVSYPDDTNDFKGTLSYDGQEITPLQLTTGYYVEDVSLLTYQPLPYEFGTNYCQFKFRVKDNGGEALIGNHSERYDFVIHVNNLDTPPISKDTTIVLRQSETYTGDIDDDIYFLSYDNASFASFIVTTLPGKGTLQHNGSGSFANVVVGEEIPSTATLQYSPGTYDNTDFRNWGTFNFKVKDSNSLESEEYTFHIHLLVTLYIVDFEKSQSKNDQIHFTQTDFDDHYFDFNNDPLDSIIVATVPANGELFFNSVLVEANDRIPYAKIETEDFHFQPDSFYHGTTTFEYSVINTAAEEPLYNATISLIYSDDRHPPVAVDDVASTTVNIPVWIDALANDYDEDGDSIYLERIVSESNGTAEIIDELVYFTPDHLFSGTATIDYEICDGIDGCSQATITITVTNDIPEISDIYYSGYLPDTIYFSQEDFKAHFDDALPIDRVKFTSLPDGSEGTLYRISGVALTPNEEITVSLIDSIHYVPVSSDGTVAEQILWNGSDGIDYADADATVFINMKERTYPPVAVDDSATTDVITTIEIVVLANDYDPDGDPLRIVDVTLEESEGERGEISIIGEVPNQKVEYIPTQLFSGEVIAHYTITDDRDGTAEANIYITVNAAEGTPSTSGFEYYLRQDTPKHFVRFDFDENFDDPNNLPLEKVVFDSLPRNGILTLEGNPIVRLQEIPYDLLDSVLYSPNEGYAGLDSVDWTGSNGTLYAREFSQISLTVIPGYRGNSVVLDDILKQGEHGAQLTVEKQDFAAAYHHPNGDTLKYIRIESVPENGYLFYNEDTIQVGDAIEMATYSSLHFIPDDGFTGIDSAKWNGKANIVYADTAANLLFEVGPELQLFNAFTPNGDNINDYWHIKDIEYYPNNTVKIFNKWGLEVFSTTSYNNEDIRWDGTNSNNGKTLGVGTYYYTVDLKDGSEVRSGFVVIAK